jgi:glycosyltransferase involved in cell wall biosynthesis
MTASVIIPCRREAQYIEKCVRSALANADDGLEIEVLVIDGMSDDGTRDSVARMQAENANVSLIDNPKRITPAAMNIGIERSHGEYIFILGAHAAIPPRYIRDCIDLLRAHSDAWCAGGVIRTIGETPTGKSIAEALSSPFGVGSARFRTGNYCGYVDTLTFGCYYRWVFERIGLFDESLVRNQDDDLNLRIVEAGGKLYMDSSIVAEYYGRSTIRRLYRQYYQYGFWRIFTMRKHGKVASVRQLVPPLFVAGLIMGLALATILPCLRVPYIVALVLYLAFLGYGAAASTKRCGIATALRLPWIFFVLHWSYGLGFWFGSIAPLFHDNRRDKSRELTR